jgi:hypothetical protein
MKTRQILIPALLLLAACQRLEQEHPVLPSNNPCYSLNIKATKIGAQTKSLLLTSGNYLDAYWSGLEEVDVFKAGSLLGNLGVTPDAGDKPTSASLSGDISASGLVKNDELTLLLPRKYWNYAGQTGTLTGKGSIEDTYAYAKATVAITNVDGNSVNTTSASFENQQSIYRISFTSGEALSIKSFIISSTNGNLVVSRAFDAGSWTSSYGALEVTPASATSEALYVALRNETIPTSEQIADQTAVDTYHFVITNANDALYLASKEIPAHVLDAPKFIGVTEINAIQPYFGPMDNGSTIQDTNLIF